jgi:hypothetical protein
MVVGDLLLDDAPVMKQVNRALWKPVLFESKWHPYTAEYAGLPSWGWGDPIDELLSYA